MAKAALKPDPVQSENRARVYKGTQELDHDLFKLLPATMLKDVGYNPNDPIIERFEHAHIFHTVDSNGRRLETCNAVGGHHHEVEVIAGKDGVPSLKVSPPMKWVKKRMAGKLRRVAVPLQGDEHTHDVQYLGSERIKVRQMNEEFARLESAIRAKQNPSVEGVLSD